MSFQILEWAGDFGEGQKVVITGRLFEGYLVIFQALSGQQRAILLLNSAKNTY